MRRSHWLARCGLGLILAFSIPTVVGCEDENDPKTWIEKLSNDAKRPGATHRLVGLFNEVMAATRPTANNPQDPSVRRFLDATLPSLVPAFSTHPDDSSFRQEAIEILAQCQDPRAIPALISALSYHPGNADSERIALRAAQALKDAARTMPDAQKPAVVQALLSTLDRAQGSSGSPQQIRYNTVQALGALRTTAAVDTLVRLLTRPLAEQDISTARAAADALGDIGDPRGTDALVYGLYLNVRAQNAFPHCLRALAKIGSQQAVPKLVQTLQGQNPQVENLITQYRAIPNAPPVPDGLVKSTAANVLRAFAAPESASPLLTVLHNRNEPDNVRGDASEALAYIAVASPAQRDQILSAITSVFNENSPSTEHTWSASLMAPRLALIGDPRSIPVVLGALRNRAIQDDSHANARVDLLSSLVSLARHDHVPTCDQISRDIREQLQHMVQRDPDAAHEAQPYLTALDRINTVLSTARDCPDGAQDCYVTKLNDSNNEVVRKAAYMIAWTTPPERFAQARTAVLGRIRHPDVAVRRSIMVALDRLSPGGCAECITQLTQLIDSERGQESKVMSHLDAQLLIARLRNRGGAAPTPVQTAPSH